MFHLCSNLFRVVSSKPHNLFWSCQFSKNLNSYTRNYCIYKVKDGGGGGGNDKSDANKSSCKYEAVLLKSRSLIKLQGPDTLTLLQGLITNDVGHFENRPAIYALFLNHQGRVLWDTILYHVKEDSDTKIFLECDSSVKSSVINHLKIFKLRKKVDFVDLEGDHASAIDLWVVFDHGHTTAAKELVKDECCGPTLYQSAKRPDLPVSVDDTLKSFGDPRLNELGWRVFVPRQNSISFPPKDIQVSDEKSYKRLRYTLGVAEGVEELPSGSCFPLESNGDFLHGVSFHKGCYIGQELTARTHHTGVVRKRIMPFRLADGSDLNNADLSSLSLESPSGKKSLGKIRGISENIGIGLIRIDDALSAPDLQIGNCKVHIERPYWWPVEASKEKQTRQ